MVRIARILGWSLGVVFVLVAVAAGGLYLLATSDYARGLAEGQASAFSGRKTRIAKITVDWGSIAHVHMQDVEVANPDWAKVDHMLKIAEVDFEIRLWPLLKGDIRLPSLTLRKPEIDVETSDQDQSNWSFEQSPVANVAAKAAAPKERSQTPLVGRFEVVEGKLGYRDSKRKLELDGTVSTATGKAGYEPQAELSLKGKLEGQPLAVRFVGGSVLMLRDTDKPYPVDLDVAYGATKLTMKGTLQDPIQWKGADVQLSLSGPNLADIYPLLGIPGPPTPPYRITGKLDREPGVWKFHDTAWHVGDSDLAGDVLVDQRVKPSHLTAKLVSQKLVFADLAPLVGASPGNRPSTSPQQKQTEAQLRAAGELFPDVPLHVERLRAMNMDVTLDAKHVLAPAYLPVSALMFRVAIDNGRATVKPLTLALVSGGTVSGELAIDAQTDNPAVRTALVLKDIEFGNFFRGSRYFDTTRGKIQGRVVLAGRGKSLAHVMGSADGHVTAAMAGGSVSSLMVSLAGLQIFDALVLYVTGDNRIPIACAVGRLNFQHGSVAFDRTLLDTQKSVLHIEGGLSLQSQAVKIELKADRKNFDLLDLHGPVVVAGKIRTPQVSLARVIPIPTPVIGDAKNVDCPAVTRQLLAAP